MPRSRSAQALLAALLAAGVAGVSAQADDPPPPRPADDLVITIKARTEVAVQKLELEVRDGLAAANKLLASDPDKALERLRQLQSAVEADTALPPARRDLLVKRVADRVAEAEARKKAVAARGGELDGKLSSKAKLRLEAERYAAEQRELKLALERIESLNRLGRAAEAQREADALSKKYPDEPVAIAIGQSTGMADRIAAARELLGEQQKRVGLAMRDIDRSALPPIGDIEFPKDWAEKTKNRKGKTLTKKEQAIMQALAKPVTIRVRDEPFEEVIQYLSDAMGQPLLLDKSDLADANVESNTPVTLQTPGKGLTTRTVLRKLLHELGLTYVIKGEEIRIISQLKAREMMTTEVYPIGDLVRGTGLFGNATIWGPYAEQEQARENARQIVETIETQVAPDSWRSRGGDGSITFHFPSGSLIVRQTAEVHMMLKGGSLR